MPGYTLVKDQDGKVLGLWFADRQVLESPGLLEAVLAKDERTVGLIGQSRRILPNTHNNDGGIFVMFGTSLAPGEASSPSSRPFKPSEKLYIGMSYDEVVAILGEPAARQGGDAMLGRYGKVSGSPRAVAAIGQQEFCIWLRGEGEYDLVFQNGKLMNISSVPK
jgi:hypothetical protein